MNKSKATTEHAKTTRTRRGRAKPTAMKIITNDLQPKVQGLWGLSVEHHQSIEHLKECVDQLIAMSNAQARSTELARDAFTMRLQLHELEAHGMITSTRECGHAVDASTQAPPTLRLVEGGRRETSGGVPTRGVSAKRRALRAIDGGRGK